MEPLAPSKKDEAVLSELMKTQKRPNLIKELARQTEFTTTSHRSRWLKVSSNNYVHRNIMLIES